VIPDKQGRWGEEEEEVEEGEDKEKTKKMKTGPEVGITPSHFDIPEPLGSKHNKSVSSNSSVSQY
jgi:hypothetical protein